MVYVEGRSSIYTGRIVETTRLHSRGFAAARKMRVNGHPFTLPRPHRDDGVRAWGTRFVGQREWLVTFTRVLSSTFVWEARSQLFHFLAINSECLWYINIISSERWWRFVSCAKCDIRSLRIFWKCVLQLSSDKWENNVASVEIWILQTINWFEMYDDSKGRRSFSVYQPEAFKIRQFRII